MNVYARMAALLQFLDACAQKPYPFREPDPFHEMGVYE
jgi:hypothetical protein